jgi:hypothetical protein
VDSPSVYIRKGADVVDVMLPGESGPADAVFNELVRLGKLVASRMPISNGAPPEP